MAESENGSYEHLREMVAGLGTAGASDQRHVAWADVGHSIGLSRDEHGMIELFLVGAPLQAADPLVRQSLEHHRWTAENADPVEANRLVLPPGEHFDSVAAVFCVELLDRGAAHDLSRAFQDSEPLIALALRRAGLSDRVLVGLIGELVAIDALVAFTDDPARIVGSWAGSVPSSRDVQLGPVGVEVKTTVGTESEHHVQGFHQVELGKSVGEVPETHLFMLSLGIQWQAPDLPGQTLPALVDQVLGALPHHVRRAFLDRVKQYGGDVATGYDHDRHRESSRYCQPFLVTFERLYDMTDDRLHLLRSADVQHLEHVDASSVSYRVQLPRRVRGDLNPVVGMRKIVLELGRIGAV